MPRSSAEQPVTIITNGTSTEDTLIQANVAQEIAQAIAGNRAEVLRSFSPMQILEAIANWLVHTSLADKAYAIETLTEFFNHAFTHFTEDAKNLVMMQKKRELLFLALRALTPEVANKTDDELQAYLLEKEELPEAQVRVLLWIARYYTVREEHVLAVKIFTQLKSYPLFQSDKKIYLGPAFTSFSKAEVIVESEKEELCRTALRFMPEQIEMLSHLSDESRRAGYRDVARLYTRQLMSVDTEYETLKTLKKTGGLVADIYLYVIERLLLEAATDKAMGSEKHKIVMRIYALCYTEDDINKMTSVVLKLLVRLLGEKLKLTEKQVESNDMALLKRELTCLSGEFIKREYVNLIVDHKYLEAFELLKAHPSIFGERQLNGLKKEYAEVVGKVFSKPMIDGADRAVLANFLAMNEHNLSIDAGKTKASVSSNRLKHLNEDDSFLSVKARLYFFYQDYYQANKALQALSFSKDLRLLKVLVNREMLVLDASSADAIWDFADIEQLWTFTQDEAVRSHWLFAEYYQRCQTVDWMAFILERLAKIKAAEKDKAKIFLQQHESAFEKHRDYYYEVLYQTTKIVDEQKRIIASWFNAIEVLPAMVEGGVDPRLATSRVFLLKAWLTCHSVSEVAAVENIFLKLQTEVQGCQPVSAIDAIFLTKKLLTIAVHKRCSLQEQFLLLQKLKDNIYSPLDKESVNQEWASLFAEYSRLLNECEPLAFPDVDFPEDNLAYFSECSAKLRHDLFSGLALQMHTDGMFFQALKQALNLRDKPECDATFYLEASAALMNRWRKKREPNDLFLLERIYHICLMIENEVLNDAERTELLAQVEKLLTDPKIKNDSAIRDRLAALLPKTTKAKSEAATESAYPPKAMTRRKPTLFISIDENNGLTIEEQFKFKYNCVVRGQYNLDEILSFLSQVCQEIGFDNACRYFDAITERYQVYDLHVINFMVDLAITSAQYQRAIEYIKLANNHFLSYPEAHFILQNMRFRYEQKLLQDYLNQQKAMQQSNVTQRISLRNADLHPKSGRWGHDKGGAAAVLDYLYSDPRRILNQYDICNLITTMGQHLRRFDMAEQIYQYAFSMGLVNGYIWGAIIEAAWLCHLPQKAWELFNTIPPSVAPEESESTRQYLTRRGISIYAQSQQTGYGGYVDNPSRLWYSASVIRHGEESTPAIQIREGLTPHYD